MNKQVKSYQGSTLLKLEEAERARRLEETVTVLSQPHRRGESSELRESALGRFVMDNQCGRECFEAGMDYRNLTYRWRLATGVRVPKWVSEEFGHSDGDMDSAQLEKWVETIDEWNKQIKSCKSALKRVGESGYKAADDMIFEDIEPGLWISAPVKRAILALAIEMCRYPY